MTQQLIKYEAACQALAECTLVDEVKEWADKAAAMQAYQRMAGDKTLEVQAAEIRMRAERRLGELLLAQKNAHGLNRGGRPTASETPSKKEAVSQTPPLSAVGIDHKLSSRAQKLAAVPEAEFEAEVGQWRERVSAEGARVSARLEAAGEREQRKGKAASEPAEPDPVLAELESAQKEIEKLTAEIQAAEADDLKAEALKWRRSYEHAQRQQSEAMDRAVQERKRFEFKHRQLMRCGRAVGETDPDKVAPAVEAFVRQYRKTA